MYYCDCMEAWKAKGFDFSTKFTKETLKKNMYLVSGIYKAQPVDTADGICIHCGHTAVWSKKPLTETLTSSVVEEGIPKPVGEESEWNF